MAPKFTLPGLSPQTAEKVITLLQDRLIAYQDLQLVLKHVHWNVVGPHFIGVHEMIDPQVDAVREFADEVAERIAALGGEPDGRAGTIVRDRSWEDYSLMRDSVPAHLGALDLVYDGVIETNRKDIDATEDEPVTQDMLIAQTGALEKFQWFVRAHLESAGGTLSVEGAGDEKQAAEAAAKAAAGAP